MNPWPDSPFNPIAWLLFFAVGARAWLQSLATVAVDANTARALLAAIGVISSVVTFAFSNVMARPALVRWRGAAWTVLVLWWTAVVLCVGDVLLPGTIGDIPNVGVKLGVLVWLIGLVRLIGLTGQILFLQAGALGSLSRRKFAAFPDLNDGTCGVAVLDWWADQLRVQRRELHFPMLLIHDRDSPALRLARHLLVAGLSCDEGVVYLTFTRPAQTIVRQLARLAKGKVSPALFRTQVVIIDGYSPLYAQDRPQHTVSDSGLSARVTLCDSRDPVAVQHAYTRALRDLKQAGAKGARVVYDSLTDFIAIADPDLVAGYLRQMVVFEEDHHVRALYLLWPDVLTQPMSDQYLSWFFASVLRLRTTDGAVTATLENVTGIQGQVRLDARLDLADRGIDVNAPRTVALAAGVKALNYKAIPFDDALLLPIDASASAQREFFFYLTAIDHRTSPDDGQYQASVNGRVLHGSDLMYARANLCADRFTTKDLLRISEGEVADIFRNGDGSTIESPGLRAWLLRQCAEMITDAYSGSFDELLNQCERRLEAPDHTGLLQRLAAAKAYEDPLRKKSHLLAKLLQRRHLFTSVDPEHQDVPADPVLVHVALLSRLIVVADQELLDVLIHRKRLTANHGERLRLATLRACRQVSSGSGLVPYELDDLLWGLGRELQKSEREIEASLASHSVVQGIGNKGALASLLTELKGHVLSPNPLARIERPLFPRTWYY